MKNDQFKILFRVFNIWLGFVTLFIFAAHLPHWPNYRFHHWVNEALYVFLFLLAFSVSVKEKNHKDVFINLSVFFLINSFSFVNALVGKDCLIPDIALGYNIFFIKRLIIYFIYNFSILYISLKYHFGGNNTLKTYMLTLIVFLPVYIIHFYPFLSHIGHHSEFTYQLFLDFNKRSFLLYLYTLLYILLYGYNLYRRDKPIGEYIHLLMAVFFIFHIVCLIDMFAFTYRLRIQVMTDTILTGSLFFFCYILLKKLCFLCTDYGQFYEALLHQKISLGKIPVQRRRDRINHILIQIIQIYFSQRRHYFLILTILCAVIIGYFNMPTFFTLNLIGVLFSIYVLVIFFSMLYKKREKNNYTLT